MTDPSLYDHEDVFERLPSDGRNFGVGRGPPDRDHDERTLLRGAVEHLVNPPHGARGVGERGEPGLMQGGEKEPVAIPTDSLA